MSYIENVLNRLSTTSRKRIVLPEAEDERVVEAAKKASSFADIILIGTEEVEGVTTINPSTYEHTEEFINEFYEMRKEKGLTLEEARKTMLENSRSFAAMLVFKGYADGVVTGACHTSADTFRTAFQIIKSKSKESKASAFFIMETKNTELGNNGVILYADCGLNQMPDASLLANIAVTSADTYESLIGGEPAVAMLSHSTYGSSKCDDSAKVVEATRLAKELAPNRNIDGEMQFDAAIVPEVAISKAPGSTVAGHANTFVFPDLDAGNIAYKITQRIGGANAYGPLVQGLSKPVNDLSRGCSVDDIVGVIAITALQANMD
jgi:phosphate acetyltransferase